jgi:UDP-N-acetylglucosamine diphosphorylase / glucose-1-phosphate thymidylyltransferase / UDP-N-acetylgalactosamine diphosphorylase / glucosamine-1-phosphate N-acetyltransferase / galactosamine-1-phosphate N-acetyltransferase
MDALRPDEASLADTLFPFTWTRSVLDIRVGILTLREKWERMGATDLAMAQVMALATSIRHPWHIFELNGLAIRNDFALVTKGRQSQPIPPSVQIIGSPLHIFIEEGATISHSILNAATGPIYIGKNTEIMEGAMIRGPFALCEGSVVKMGATIYGATTVGPYSTVGGEIKNSVIFGYSNKAHHGYLGDSVIGEWCNLGAGTSNSNLKNNAGPVKVWDEAGRQFASAGLKCGLLMGDYSRSAINTSFNTGTVVGVCCNVFGDGLTPKYIPSFSWGVGKSRGGNVTSGDEDVASGSGEPAAGGPALVDGNRASAASRYEWEKALRDIANWKKLKNQSLRDDEIQNLKLIFERSSIKNDHKSKD